MKLKSICEMKKGLILTLAISGLLVAGCSGGGDDGLPSAPAPSGGASVDATVAPVAPAAPEPGQTTAPASAEPVEPQLAPIQIAIANFEQQNKRMPLNIQEMVDAGVLKDLPAPPPGKIYFIDHATKKVRLGGGP